MTTWNTKGTGIPGSVVETLIKIAQQIDVPLVHLERTSDEEFIAQFNEEGGENVTVTIRP